MKRFPPARWLGLAALAAVAVTAVACTPTDDTGGSSTTTTAPVATTTTLASTTTPTVAGGGSTPTLTDVAYAISGVTLRFTAPSAPGKTIVNYVYDLSC